MNRYGSRKFVIALVAMLIAAALRWRGVLADDSTTTVLVAAVLGYQGANVAGKVADAKAAQ